MSNYIKQAITGNNNGCDGCVADEHRSLCHRIQTADCGIEFVWVDATAAPDTSIAKITPPAKLTAAQARELAQEASERVLDSVLEQVRIVAAEGYQLLHCANVLSEPTIHKLNKLGFGVHNKISITW